MTVLSITHSSEIEHLNKPLHPTPVLSKTKLVTENWYGGEWIWTTVTWWNCARAITDCGELHKTLTADPQAHIYSL